MHAFSAILALSWASALVSCHNESPHQAVNTVLIVKTVTRTVHMTQRYNTITSTTGPVSDPARTSVSVVKLDPARPSSDYMVIVSEYREKLGLKRLEKSSKLEANVLQCLQESPGKMVHKLNAGSFAQVLAPIPDFRLSSFKHAFVGGWLCEDPNHPSLVDECKSQSKGWIHVQGQTDHAKILTSSSYSEIGCNWSKGICGCDLA